MNLSVGIHAVDAETYHSDPCDTPSLSASIANILINQSPAHAKAAHPKLNPELERTEEAKFDIGTTAHALLLQNDNLIQVCDYPDWRTKDAKTARDETRAAGRIPLLPGQAANVRAMVAAAREGLASHTAQPPLFTAGKPEQTIVWGDDHGVVCRARLDWLRDDFAAIDDMKTSAVGNPFVWTRKTMWAIGAPLQARFYQRGVKALTGIEPVFRFCLIETQPPYAISFVDLAPAAAALADAQIEWALRTWAECLAKDEWPGYPQKVFSAEPPPWLEAEWLDREWLTREAA